MNDELYEQIKTAAYEDEMQKLGGFGKIVAKSFKHLGKAVKSGISYAKEKAKPSFLRKVSPFKSKSQKRFTKSIKKSKAALGTVGGVGAAGYVAG